jgi:mannitol/fructose-specific phosphotransferase system IIA component (Ntr-type)
VLSREETRSTGVGEGIAVPHGKSTGCQQLCMAVGKPAEPLEFDSIDGRPCELVVLLASPIDTTGPHIQALGRVSRLWRQSGFRGEVGRVETADDLYAAVKQFQG